MTSNPFRNVDAKLLIAQKRVIDLKLSAHEWAKKHPARVIHQHDPKTGWHLLHGEPFPDPPDEWAAILGELVYGLRAGLNQTVELLIRANQNVSQRANQFPIIAKIEDAHLLAPQLAGVHPEAAALIKAVQPYNRPHRANPEPLEAIAALSTASRHASLENR